MSKTIILKSALIMIGFAILFGCSSNSSHLDDPNALVIVTSQYEGSAEKLILPPTKKCSPPFDCADQHGANCAAALFENALEHIAKADEMQINDMPMAARVEYLMAECRLTEAQSVLKESKLTNYIDFKIATSLGLEAKIKRKIQYCQRQGMSLQWRR